MWLSCICRWQEIIYPLKHLHGTVLFSSIFFFLRKCHGLSPLTGVTLISMLFQRPWATWKVTEILFSLFCHQKSLTIFRPSQKSLSRIWQIGMGHFLQSVWTHWVIKLGNFNSTILSGTLPAAGMGQVLALPARVTGSKGSAQMERKGLTQAGREGGVRSQKRPLGGRNTTWRTRRHQ